MCDSVVMSTEPRADTHEKEHQKDRKRPHEHMTVDTDKSIWKRLKSEWARRPAVMEVGDAENMLAASTKVALWAAANNASKVFIGEFFFNPAHIKEACDNLHNYDKYRSTEFELPHLPISIFAELMYTGEDDSSYEVILNADIENAYDAGLTAIYCCSPDIPGVGSDVFFVRGGSNGAAGFDIEIGSEVDQSFRKTGRIRVMFAVQSEARYDVSGAVGESVICNGRYYPAPCCPAVDGKCLNHAHKYQPRSYENGDGCVMHPNLVHRAGEPQIIWKIWKSREDRSDMSLCFSKSSASSVFNICPPDGLWQHRDESQPSCCVKLVDAQTRSAEGTSSIA